MKPLIALTLTAALVACTPDAHYYETGSVYGESDDFPVYTEGTRDDTFDRIDADAQGG